MKLGISGADYLQFTRRWCRDWLSTGSGATPRDRPRDLARGAHAPVGCPLQLWRVLSDLRFGFGRCPRVTWPVQGRGRTSTVVSPT